MTRFFFQENFESLKIIFKERKVLKDLNIIKTPQSFFVLTAKIQIQIEWINNGKVLGFDIEWRKEAFLWGVYS